MIRSRHLVGVIVGMAALVGCDDSPDPGNVSATTVAASARSVTPSRTDMVQGNVLRIDGTGCVDPDPDPEAPVQIRVGVTEAGTIDRPITSKDLEDTEPYPVLSDGSFTAGHLVGEDTPPGPADLDVVCTRGSGSTESIVFAFDPIDLTVTSPYAFVVSPQQARPGDTLSIEAECSSGPVPEPPTFTIEFRPDEGPAFELSTLAAEPMVSETVQLPATAQPGTYLVRASCRVQRTPDVRWFGPLEFVIEAG